jgi:hypothetical protein
MGRFRGLLRQPQSKPPGGFKVKSPVAKVRPGIIKNKSGPAAKPQKKAEWRGRSAIRLCHD